MQPTQPERSLTHDWQDRGFQPPYAFLDVIDRGPRNHTSCDVCGTGIRYECILRDASGRMFKVGNDCIRKYGDTKLMSEAEKALKARRKLQREAKRRRDEDARMAEIAAQREAERERNGGLTDWEMQEKARKDAAANLAAQKREQFAWLFDVFDPADSGFMGSILRSIEQGQMITERGSWIASQIYAKAYVPSGRGKKYEALRDEAYDNLAPILARPDPMSQFP